LVIALFRLFVDVENTSIEVIQQMHFGCFSTLNAKIGKIVAPVKEI